MTTFLCPRCNRSGLTAYELVRHTCQERTPESELAIAKELFGEIEPVAFTADLPASQPAPTVEQLQRQLEALRGLLASERARADKLAADAEAIDDPTEISA